MKITNIYGMLEDITKYLGGGNDIYVMYKALKQMYLERENEHPDFCGFIEMYYYDMIVYAY